MLTTIARIGRVEKNQLQNGDTVLRLSLAYNYGKRGQDGKTPSQWMQTAIFGKQADAMEQYLTVGTAIVITVKDVHIETFKNKDGLDQSKLVGSYVNLQFVPKGDGQKTQAPAPAPKPPPPAPAPTPNPYGDDMDDDIPF